MPVFRGFLSGFLITRLMLKTLSRHYMPSYLNSLFDLQILKCFFSATLTISTIYLYFPCSPYREENSFVELYLAFNLSQIVTELTRITKSSRNMLDLILVSDPALIEPILFLGSLSDHRLLHTSLHVLRPLKPVRKQIKLYEKADFPFINSELTIYTTFTTNFHERNPEKN